MLSWEGTHELPSLLTEVVLWAWTGELPALLCDCWVWAPAFNEALRLAGMPGKLHSAVSCFGSSPAANDSSILVYRSVTDGIRGTAYVL